MVTVLVMLEVDSEEVVAEEVGAETLLASMSVMKVKGVLLRG